MGLIKRIITKVVCAYNGVNYKTHSWLHPTIKILGTRNIEISEGVNLHKGVLLDTSGMGKIEFGKNCNVNSYSRIESMEYVMIAENVLMGPYVYISDRNHEYRDIEKPVMIQGYNSRGGINWRRQLDWYPCRNYRQCKYWKTLHYRRKLCCN